jgi:hypothetical protein
VPCHLTPCPGGDRLGGLPRSFQESAIAIPDIAEPHGPLALAGKRTIASVEFMNGVADARKEARVPLLI